MTTHLHAADNGQAITVIEMNIDSFTGKKEVKEQVAETQNKYKSTSRIQTLSKNNILRGDIAYTI